MGKDVSELSQKDPPKESCLRPSLDGSSEGCAPRTAIPSAPKGKLYPFHIDGTLASHVTIKSNCLALLTFCPRATISTVCLRASRFSRNAEQLRTPGKSLGENGTVIVGNDPVNEGYPRSTAHPVRGVPVNEWVPAVHERVSALQYEKLATKNNILSL